MFALIRLRTLLLAIAIALPMFAVPAAQAQIASAGRDFGPRRTAGAAGVCAATAASAGIYLDAGLLGVGDAGYYWVPGVWVHHRELACLWTPGYWGFAGGLYAWHAGYWGPHVGFYGGVNYGFGYSGVGFCWR